MLLPHGGAKSIVVMSLIVRLQSDNDENSDNDVNSHNSQRWDQSRQLGGTSVYYCGGDSTVIFISQSRGSPARRSGRRQR